MLQTSPIGQIMINNNIYTISLFSFSSPAVMMCPKQQIKMLDGASKSFGMHFNIPRRQTLSSKLKYCMGLGVPLTQRPD